MKGPAQAGSGSGPRLAGSRAKPRPWRGRPVKGRRVMWGSRHRLGALAAPKSHEKAKQAAWPRAAFFLYCAWKT